MRLPGLALALSLAACGEDAATGACGEIPERVMKFEPGALKHADHPWQIGEQVFLPLHHADDIISLYTAERCGDGEPEQRVGPELGLEWAYIVDTAAGSLLMGHRKATGELLRIDRREVPGRDAPQTIATLDEHVRFGGRTGLFCGGLLLWADDPANIDLIASMRVCVIAPGTAPNI